MSHLRNAYRSMATQLDRVNNTPEHLRVVIQEQHEQIADLERQIARLKTALANKDQALREAETRAQANTGRDQRLVDGRPWVTVAEAARMIGVSQSSVYRYLAQNKLSGPRIPGSKSGKAVWADLAATYIPGNRKTRRK